MSDSVEFITARDTEDVLGPENAQRKTVPTFDSYVLNGKLSTLALATIHCEIYNVDNFVWRICN
ncbi:MAG: hypothetical protein U0103_06460 [Candidatus Obscuribacterales bacterium]